MRAKLLFPLMAALAAIALLGCSNPVNPKPNAIINIAAIPGVTAPAYGATPVTAITETAQYTGTVVWDGSPANFAASTVYTATITLTAKAGYTLTGVTADFFTVAGTTSDTNPENTGIVTAVFPATGSAPVTVPDVTSISLNTADFSLALGKTKSIVTSYLPIDASSPIIDYSTGNSAVATVSSTGLVLGVGAGSTSVTASVHGNPGISASCTVTVVQVGANGVYLKVFDSGSGQWIDPKAMTSFPLDLDLLINDGWTWYGRSAGTTKIKGWYGTNWFETNSSTYGGYNRLSTLPAEVTQLVNVDIKAYAVTDTQIYVWDNITSNWVSPGSGKPDSLPTGYKLPDVCNRTSDFYCWKAGQKLQKFNGSAWVEESSAALSASVTEMIVDNTKVYARDGYTIKELVSGVWQDTVSDGVPATIPATTKFLRKDSYRDYLWYVFLSTGEIKVYNASNGSWVTPSMCTALPAGYWDICNTGVLESLSYFTSAGVITFYDCATDTFIEGSQYFDFSTCPPSSRKFYCGNTGKAMAIGLDHKLYTYENNAWTVAKRGSNDVVSIPPETSFMTYTEGSTGQSGWSWWSMTSDNRLFEFTDTGVWVEHTGVTFTGYGYVSPLPVGQAIESFNAFNGESYGVITLVSGGKVYEPGFDSTSGWALAGSGVGLGNFTFNGSVPVGTQQCFRDRWNNLIALLPNPY